VTTEASPGISSSLSGTRLAETTIASLTGAGVGGGVGEGVGDCAPAKEAKKTANGASAHERRRPFREETECMDNPSFLSGKSSRFRETEREV
jgi:hypothetical protein